MHWFIMPVLGSLSLTMALRAFAGSEGMNGTFVLNPDKSDNIDRAIENALSKLSLPIRTIARHRLQKTNELFGSVTIELSTAQITIGVDSRPLIHTPADGKAIKWTQEDGEEVDVSTKLENGRLCQIFIAKDGKRINLYQLTPDGGELILLATTCSDRLKEPLCYKLVYERKL